MAILLREQTEKEQAITCKILHKKLKFKQNYPKKPRMNAGALEE
jgi:hypothetical protein